MEINATSFIYLFGAAQALLLTIGINYRQPLATTTKVTTSISLVVMLALMLYYTIVLNDPHFLHPYLHSLGSAVWMAITPAYFLLLESIREPRWKLRWSHGFYFSLSGIFLVELLLNGAGAADWLYAMIGSSRTYLDLWMSGFFLAGFYFVGRTLYGQYEPSQREKNKHLRWFSYALLTLLVVFAVLYLFVRRDYVIWFELTLVVLCEIFVFMLVFRTFRSMSLRQMFDAHKYDSQEAPPAKLQVLAEQLEATMMETEVYLEKELKLSDLARHSGIGTNVLSQLFSIHYASNFYDFVNQYRLAHLEKMLLDERNRQYKILALAEESGFKSKTTFYKVFKEKHGVTPAQFMKRVVSN